MDRVLILDFGSQYTQLIARRVREVHVYSEIQPCTWSVGQVRAFAPKAIILSGGPASVADDDAPRLDPAILRLGVPVLGICYGMQAMAQVLGGTVARGTAREYGRATIEYNSAQALLTGVDVERRTRDAGPVDSAQRRRRTVVWMSHGDHVVTVPPRFSTIATGNGGLIAAMADDQRKLYGLQFHPEVAHTEQGRQILRNFLVAVSGCSADWSMQSFIATATARLRREIGTGKVLCGVSGGVDSSVVAALLHQAIGDQLTCLFVNNGLLRKGEEAKVPRLFDERLGIRIHTVDAGRRFLMALRGIEDPEEKRKRIGREFIAVFEEEARTFGDAQFLAQGTLYPDVIESVSAKGPSATIKSHHNVGGLPATMALTLIEPLRELFKDEVRDVGRALGMPDELIGRQPFPGPGLAVRILGAVTEERLATLRAADDVMMQEIKAAGWYERVWQSFCVLLPVKTVGVMGDERTYEKVVALRVVTSQDGMTADWAPLPYDVLGRIANRIINEVNGVNRVVYDISSKPPATIEWE